MGEPSDKTRAFEAGRAAGALPTEYLCFCAETYPSDFADAIRQRAEASFESVCLETGVGLHCTACVQAAELVYLDMLAEDADQPTAPAARQPRRRIEAKRDRITLRSVLRRLSPMIANRARSVCPVLRSKRLRTSLCIANVAVPSIAIRQVAFKIRVVLRDTDGRRVWSKSRRIAPNEYCELPISDALPEPTNGELSVGSAELTLVSIGMGYQGATRPHFKPVHRRRHIDGAHCRRKRARCHAHL